MRAWIFLAAAIGFEVLGTSLLRMSDGFTKWQFSAASIAAFSVSFWLLSQVLTKIPMGVSYAVWSGVGIVLISIIGVLAFGQTLKPIQLMFIGLILVGAIGLNLTTDVSGKAVGGDDTPRDESASA